MNKRDSIIEAALQLLVVNGIHATPMSAIAKAANTGMGTIYNYFATKELLINAIYLDIKQREEALLTTSTEHKSIKEKFDYFYLMVTNYYIQHPLYFRFIEQLQHSPIISEESRAAGYKAIAPVITVLKDGQREGIIKKMEIEELLQFLGGALISHARWALNNTKQKQSFENQLQLVWDAIKN